MKTAARFVPLLVRAVVVHFLAGCAGAAGLQTVGLPRAAPPAVEFVPQFFPRSEVTAAALSSSGQLALIGEKNGQVFLLDTITEKILAKLHAHTDRVLQLRFASDDRQALSAAEDGTLCTIDIIRGRLLQCRRTAPAAFTAIDISTDSRYILAGSRNPGTFADTTQVQMWEAETGRSVLSLRAHHNKVYRVAFSADGRMLASSGGGTARGIHVWDTASGRRLATVAADGRTPQFFAFSKEGALVSAQPGSLLEWRLAAPGIEAKLPADIKEISNFHALSRRRVLIAHDGQLTVFSYADQKVLLSGQQAVYRSTTAVSGDGRVALLIDTGHRMFLFDLETGDALRALHPLETALSSGVITLNGRVVLGAEGGIFELDLTTGAITAKLDQGVTVKQLSEDGNFAVVGKPVYEHIFNPVEATASAITPASRAAPEGKVSDKAIERNLDFSALSETDSAVANLRPRENDTLVGLAQALVRPLRALAPQRSPRFVCRLAGPGCRLWVDGRRLEDAATGAEPRLVPQSEDSTGLLAISADGRRVVVRAARKLKHSRSEKDDEYGVVVMNTTNNQVVGTLRTKHEVTAVALSVDGTRMLLADGEYDTKADYGTQVRLVDVASGRELLIFRGDKDGVGAIAFSADGRRALLGGQNYRSVRRTRRTKGCDLTLVDLSRGGRVIRRLRGHTDEIQTVSFSADDRYALSLSADGTARLWRLDTGTSLTIVVGGGEWLLFSDDGYFDASRRGQELVTAVRDGRGFAMDQLAPRNNRPDILYERLGVGDAKGIAHFRARYEQRLRKLNLTEAQLDSNFESAPVSRITALRQDRESKFVELTIDLRSPAADLANYQIYVNDVPLLGALGRPIGGRSQHLQERIELDRGPNRIEVAARSSNGLESLRDFRTVEYTGQVRSELYFLGFGVSQYSDQSLNLGFADKDARDLGSIFERAKGGHFDSVHSHVFANTEVTVQSVIRAKQLLQSATVDDTVVLFFAGHGMHTRDALADYYLLTHETDLRQLRQTAASFEMVEGLLQDIAPRHKLVLIDACESGEREEGVENRAASAAVRDGLVPRTPFAQRGTIPLLANVYPRRPWLLNRERYIYNDLTRRTGAIVLSSSRGDEFSYERLEWQNGAFTSELKRGLTSSAADRDGDGVVTTEELRRYVAETVARRTGDRQHPTVDRDNLAAHFGLPVVHMP